MTAWLDNVVKHNVKASSMQIYQTYVKNQIIPHLGGLKVQDLTPATLDDWLRRLQKKGLSYNTISATHTLIHHALNYAVYPAKLISANPADYIKVPKNAPRNVVKRHIITPEQFNALLEKYPFGTPYNSAERQRIFLFNTENRSMQPLSTLKLQEETATIFAENLQSK